MNIVYFNLGNGEEGRAEGKLEDAKNLKRLGVSIDIIAEATGLSVEEIAKL